jgi:hypothetical protein
MGANGSPGINKLGQVLQERMKACGASPLLLDFGTIQGDLSLLTNTYPIPIPKTDYTVCRQLTLGATGAHLTYTVGAGKPNDGTHTHGSSGSHGGHTGGDGTHKHANEAPHVHDVLIPEKMRKLKSGDRVLVAWVQNEAVVVDIILPATAL